MLNYTTLQTIIQLVRMFFDILILWVLLYYTIKIVRNNSRTAQIFKGIVLILIIRAVANFFGFKAVDWLAGVLVTYGFLAIIIIFQPEIRSVLERLGKSSVFSRLNTLSSNERMRLVDELVNASMALSQNRMGALISIEQGHSLSDFIRTGTLMNSLVTSELLQTIFVPSTPLHDGAVIIQGDRIACASAYFPPTNLEVPSRYGARHRAAIGISEITDSVTIVISEKSGRISIAEEGKLITMNQTTLRSYLEQVIINDEADVFETDPSRVLLPTPKDASVVALEPAVEPATRATVPVSPPTKRPNFFKALFNPEPTAIDVEQDLETSKESPTKTAPPPTPKPKPKPEPKAKVELQVNPEVKVSQTEPEPKPALSPKPPIWKRWFGSTKAVETTPQPTLEVNNEPPKKVTSPRKKATAPKQESSTSPAKRTRKAASTAIEKIKDTPKIELEYSLSDPSLLDDDDAQGGGNA
jgi:diadenylate cyclase